MSRSIPKLLLARVRSWSAVVLAASALLSAPAYSTSTAQHQVEWKAKRLTVIAESVPLSDLLSEISRQTGLEVRGATGLNRIVSARFSDLPLGDAVARLLPGTSFAMMESPAPDGAKHLTVIILGGSPNGGEPAAAKDAAPAAPTSKPVTRLDRVYDRAEEGDWDALRKAASGSKGDPAAQNAALQLLANHDPDQATNLAIAATRSNDQSRKLVGIQNLAELDSPAAAQALGATLSDPDAGVRESAVASLMGQTGPDSVAALSQALNDPDDNIRMMALDLLAQRGSDGEASLSTLALHNTDPHVRTHARELLDELKTQE